MRDSSPIRSEDSADRLPEQPGKLRLLFAVATGAILAVRLADRYLPADFPPFILYAIFAGAPLAAILLAVAAHRGVWDAITGHVRSNRRQRD
jgi:hypothetical protein